MKILLITDNYLPESNPPSLRCSEHAQAWVEAGHDVEVVTSFPNFPDGRVFAGYRQSLWLKEEVDGVRLLRVPTIVFPNKGTLLRIIDQLSFMLTGGIGALFRQRPDVLIATSPQMFTAVAGWFAAKVLRCPFVLEIRDLWPDSIVAVGAMKESFAIAMLRKLEIFLYKAAHSIIVVTDSFRDNLVSRGIPPEKIFTITNGVKICNLRKQADGGALRARYAIENRIVVSYIGTVGMAHGLELVLDAAVAIAPVRPEIVFMIVGSGAELEELREKASALGLENVIFTGRVDHEEIGSYWDASDMTLVLLRDTPLFRTVIPSKIFEALGMGVPIITNVSGEVDRILADTGSAVLAPPSDLHSVVQAIERLAADAGLRAQMADAALTLSATYDRERLALCLVDTLCSKLRLTEGNVSAVVQESRDLKRD